MKQFIQTNVEGGTKFHRQNEKAKRQQFLMMNYFFSDPLLYKFSNFNRTYTTIVYISMYNTRLPASWLADKYMFWYFMEKASVKFFLHGTD